MDGKNKAGPHSRRSGGKTLVTKFINQAQRYKTRTSYLNRKTK